MRWGAKMNQGSIDSGQILGVVGDPQVDVFGEPRAIVVTNSVASDQEVANILVCEYGQEILEVLVQVRLLS